MSRKTMFSFVRRNTKSRLPPDEQGYNAAGALSFFLSREDWYHYSEPQTTEGHFDFSGDNETVIANIEHSTTSRWSEADVEALLIKVSSRVS